MRLPLLLLGTALLVAAPTSAQFSLGPNGVGLPPINLVNIFKYLSSFWYGDTSAPTPAVAETRTIERSGVAAGTAMSLEDLRENIDKINKEEIVKHSIEKRALVEEKPLNRKKRALLLPKKKLAFGKWPFVYGVLNVGLLAAALALAKPYFTHGETIVTAYTDSGEYLHPTHIQHIHYHEAKGKGYKGKGYKGKGYKGKGHKGKGSYKAYKDDKKHEWYDWKSWKFWEHKDAKESHKNIYYSQPKGKGHKGKGYKHHPYPSGEAYHHEGYDLPYHHDKPEHDGPPHHSLYSQENPRPEYGPPPYGYAMIPNSGSHEKAKRPQYGYAMNPHSQSHEKGKHIDETKLSSNFAVIPASAIDIDLDDIEFDDGTGKHKRSPPIAYAVIPRIPEQGTEDVEQNEIKGKQNFNTPSPYPHQLLYDFSQGKYRQTQKPILKTNTEYRDRSGQVEETPHNELFYFNPTVFTAEKDSSYACMERMVCENPSRQARARAIRNLVPTIDSNDSTEWENVLKRLDDAADRGKRRQNCEKYFCKPQRPEHFEQLEGDNYSPPPPEGQQLPGPAVIQLKRVRPTPPTPPKQSIFIQQLTNQADELAIPIVESSENAVALSELLSAIEPRVKSSPTKPVKPRSTKTTKTDVSEKKVEPETLKPKRAVLHGMIKHITAPRIEKKDEGSDVTN